MTGSVSDGVICLETGTYEMTQTINVSRAPGLTIKGTGASPDDTLLLFGVLFAAIASWAVRHQQFSLPKGFNDITNLPCGDSCFAGDL